MYARAPASSANLGPGFDALAVALELFVEVTVTEADAFSVTTTGEGAGLFDDERHPAARVARDILGHDRFSLSVHSEIPLARGLGSSGALAVAAAAAAGSRDPLTVAARVDGHPENAAASVRGGLVAAGYDGDVVVSVPLALDHDWRFVVAVPDAELSTAEARAALPAEVPFADAVANLNALARLVAGLADDEHYTSSAMDDRLHQPYRGALAPYTAPVIAAMRNAGAAGVCWSGAGPSILALCVESTARAVAAAAGAALAEGPGGQVIALEADRLGLVTG
ncbi:MAG TPA: homoserine kinase [Acidimicrobiales bacterium]|nr:homoserine kinase [Acidimicrobiales bacterium]